MLAQAAPDLSVTKTVDNPQPGPGQPVEFTIELTNTGPDPALSAQVLDVLPTGIAIPDGAAAFPSVGVYDPVTGVWTVGGMNPAQVATLLIPAVINDAQPPACIVNKAVASDPDDINPDNDTALAALRQPGVERCVDVSVTFGDAKLMQDGCDLKKYWVFASVFNAGPDAARDVVVELSQDPLVATGLGFIDAQCTSIVDGSCLIAELPAGEALYLEVAHPDLPLSQAVSQDLTLTVSSSDEDYDPANDLVTQTLGTGVLWGCPDLDLGDLGIGSIGPGCFIATATYGSALDPHVDALRRFRDRYLMTNSLGRNFVAFYYRHSPPLADYIAQRPWARTTARVVLTPLVFAVAYPMPALGLTLLLLLGLSYLWVMRRRRSLE
jgi:uncharacterized repeat protein (TIGR01451 family)